MWGLIATIFLGSYCLMGLYIGRRGRSTVGKSSKRIYRIIYWIIFALLFLFFPLTEIGIARLPFVSRDSLEVWGWYSMIAIVYIFMQLLVIDIIRLIDKRISFLPSTIKDNTQTPKIIGLLVILAVTITLSYGTWNARNPVVKPYELTVDKKAGDLKELRIAMVSDIHYGSIIDAERLDKMVEIMNEIQPDVILVAGDIIEGTPQKQQYELLIELFKQMDAEYGIFAVPGNHDRWLRSDEGVNAFKEAGIHVLRDELVKIEDYFYVVGRNDAGYNRGQGRKSLEDLMKGIDPILPVILLDHQPVELDMAQKNQVDLQVAGHTHMGQIFPANLITGQIYESDYGLLTKGRYNLIVSCGYGTWGPPLRIGNNPEVVYITMKFTGQQK